MLDHIVERSMVYDAWADEPWIVDGAAVRVSLVCFDGRDAGLLVRLDGEAVVRINADLSATTNLTAAVRLATNRKTAFIGGILTELYEPDLAPQTVRTAE